MKNSIINMMHSRIVIEVIGKNIENLIMKLYHHKINIYKLKKIDITKYEIIINYDDFDKLLKIKGNYEINVIRYLGIVNKKKQLLKYYHVLICLSIAIMIVFFLSHVIFKVEIITNNQELKEKLLNTLSTYGISPYHLKKDYDRLEEIKEKILTEYHDEIEWVEIEVIGTKYILRFEPKIIKEESSSTNFRHIVARKNAIIKKIDVNKGQVVKVKNDYVKKGDIIVSGYISLNDKIKDTVSSEGKVYGEVWYETKVKYPFNYYEANKTGKVKNIYSLKIFNHKIELFNFSPFNDKIVTETKIIKHPVLPISLIHELQEEVHVKTGMNVIEEVRMQAIKLAYDKMHDSLKEDEYIINYRIIDSKIIPSGIEMKIFFSVYEDITDYQQIEKYQELE